jgi:FAD:protein FMN transferase
MEAQVVTGEEGYIALARHLMATRFELALPLSGNAARLRAAGEEALDEVERLEHRLSPYRPGSDITELNARAGHEWVPVAPWLFEMLKSAADLCRHSGGAFDITVGPLMRTWGFAGGPPRVPSALEIVDVRSLTGPDRLSFDDARRMVRFDRDGVSLDVGAIGKGYAVDSAMRLLIENGVTSALLHGGTSTVAALGTGPDGQPWTVGVAHHEDAHRALVNSLLTDGDTLSVSAGRGKAFTGADGNVYGHVMDPRAAAPVQGALLAAVICGSAMEGDALSTALLVLGAGGLPITLERRPEASALVVDCDGEVHTLGNRFTPCDAPPKGKDQ